MKTPEQIAKETDHLNGKENRKMIFKIFRFFDNSHLWPINRRFNATERAINRLYKYERLSGEYLTGLELTLFLDQQISDIVNHC
ncbi:MAG: hypothetical protein WC401_12950 [Bacteroidales bacterium]